MLKLVSVRNRVLACLTLLLLVAQVWAADAVVVKVVTDRPDAMYHCSEQARFLVSVTKDGAPVTSGRFYWALSLDGGSTRFGTGSGQLGVAPAEVVGTLEQPGILRCAVTYLGGEKPVTVLGGAAFDPEKIKPTATEPADFDKFWERNKEKLAKTPMDAKLTEKPELSNDRMKVYKINLANVRGSRVYGWLAVPTLPGPHPSILTIPGAGVYAIGASWATGWASRGFTAMTLTVHDYDVDLPATTYDDLKAGRLLNYQLQGRIDRNAYYYLRMCLGCVRAIDYLTSRPDWDGKNMIVTGSSQGGGMSIITAGLDQRVTAIAANVPALCDHTGKLFGRPSGWPLLIPETTDADYKKQVTDTAAYYDAVNFARRVKCPAVVGVGLIDTTCAATSVYSAYNSLQGPKHIMVYPLMGHAIDKGYSDYTDQWMRQQVFNATSSFEIRRPGVPVH